MKRLHLIIFMALLSVVSVGAKTKKPRISTIKTLLVVADSFVE